METARLTLHEVGEGDAAFLVTLRTDPIVRRYLGGPMTVDEATSQTELTVRYAQGLFVVTRRDNGEPIGLVMLHPGHGGTEISYQFIPSSWSQGFASEAVRCVMEHAFESEGITELLAVTQTANERSRRLLERLGGAQSEPFEEFGEPQTLYRVRRLP
jgi:[ribosomal protein S5]-alanine N-acetyltransferase